ncbi:MAG: DNA mismatch repair protein MutS, partial [Firmicutes bacterium]|nr:DNA mismatch repair protein MutS [Bacillota bacterium]
MPQYTPMMEQYFEIKSKYKHCLLFFRLGDFYELFFDDAVTASKELDLVLTGRDCGMEERAPMCGVPFHSADAYVAKLVEKGYKVAICEQTEDPRFTKTLVKREVIRVVTPGTVTDQKMLDESRNNYIMCVYEDKNGFGLAACDVTTGEFAAASFPAGEIGRLFDEVARFYPAEMITNEAFSGRQKVESLFRLKPSVYHSWAFYPANAYKKLTGHFNVLNLSGFGVAENSREAAAAGALLEYLEETQKNGLSQIVRLRRYESGENMVIDMASRRNLELTETIRDRSKKNSLLGALDSTNTAMGARTLRSWVELPLTDRAQIDKRLDAVENLKDNALLREELKELLNTVLDIERIMTKIVYNTANCRDLAALKSSIRNFPHIKNLLAEFSAPLFKEMRENFDELSDIYGRIEKTIADDPPAGLREGGFIKDGFNAELDAYRDAKNSGSRWLRDLEAGEREATGVKTLKIRYNKVFGYYIEITNSYLNMAPARYIRRQTLANCERFVTEELKKIEETILGADEKAADLEYELYAALRLEVAEAVERVQLCAYMVGIMDALASLADAADRFRYCRPVVTDGGEIRITGGRHPVVERMGAGAFVPNDTFLDLGENRLAVITGPNMAGKSTYMRQVALIVLMAQIGSFVPAERAEIGLVDRIFTRVGASDDLATGQSTFMVEMTEVANILNNATGKSLIILDEIGRGTSTFDGLSIAWSVMEYIAGEKSLGAKTLFATHYHELTELEGKVGGVKNYRVTVAEQGEDIIFLRKVERGGADRSYGIQVARLAGLPPKVLKRAKDILRALSEADIAGGAPDAEGEAEETAVGGAAGPGIADEAGESEPVVYYGKRKKPENANRIIIREILQIDTKKMSVREVLRAVD